MANPTVAFAESVMTVHVKRTSGPGLLPDGTEGWDIVSKTMLPGDSILLSKMPPYLSDAIKNGSVPGLRALTSAQAKQRAKAMETGYVVFDEAEEESDTATEKE